MATRIPFTFRVDNGETVREEQLTVDCPGVVKIGSLESSHLRLDDEGVSRMHALIEVAGSGEAHVMDLGSTAGTSLDGQPVQKAKLQLRSGAQLVLGNTTVSVTIGEPVVAMQPESGTPAGAGGQAAGAPAQPWPVAPGPIPAASVVPLGGVFAPPSPMRGAAPRPAAPVADPSVDRQDGSRAIEVTAMFEQDVLRVRHLDNPAGGKVSPVTWGIIGVGWAIFLVALVLAIAGQTGFSGLLFVAGLGLGVYGLTRRADQRKSPDFALGEAVQSDLHLAHPAIPDAYFPIVRSDGREYSLLFTDAMVGDVTVGAERTELSQLVSSNRATPEPVFARTYAYPIPQDARIKLDIGSHTLLVNSVPPARGIVTSWLANVDWSVQMSNAMSFTAHALLLFLVFAVPPDAKSLSLDLFDADNKFVKYLTKPLEQKKEDIPSWLRKRGPDKAGGKGQRHKGQEGKMGKKDSKKKTGLYGLKGPKDNPDPHLAKQLAEESARHAGVLGVLGAPGGSHIASIFGRDTALGTDAEDALGGLIGDRIGEAYGLGGLGLVGTGRGGGGTGEGTIGLGSLGTIGKGGGGGDGAGYGRGAGRLGGRKARVPRVLAGRAEVRGALDKEIIRRIIRRHINEVKYCYSKELQSDEALGGRVIVQFTIAANGQVVTSKVQSSTLGHKGVERCIAQAVRRWLFPKPKGGGIVIVSYPFVLRAAGS